MKRGASTATTPTLSSTSPGSVNCAALHFNFFQIKFSCLVWFFELSICHQQILLLRSVTRRWAAMGLPGKVVKIGRLHSFLFLIARCLSVLDSHARYLMVVRIWMGSRAPLKMRHWRPLGYRHVHPGVLHVASLAKVPGKADDPASMNWEVLHEVP